MKALRSGMMMMSLLLLAGCGSTKIASCEDGRDVIWFSSVTQRMLENGTRQYEEGNYPAALNILQNVPDHPTASKKEKLEALKLMAFIHCVSNREKACRESFRKALEIDPNFELAPAEVGHPVWGPVFQSVKKSYVAPAATVPAAAPPAATPAVTPAAAPAAPAKPAAPAAAPAPAAPAKPAAPAAAPAASAPQPVPASAASASKPAAPAAAPVPAPSTSAPEVKRAVPITSRE